MTAIEIAKSCEEQALKLLELARILRGDKEATHDLRVDIQRSLKR
jgi:hypothetical protein